MRDCHPEIARRSRDLRLHLTDRDKPKPPLASNHILISRGWTPNPAYSATGYSLPVLSFPCSLVPLSLSIHRRIRQPVRFFIPAPQRVPHLKILELHGQPLRFLPQRHQPRALHLVLALHLPHHQLGIRHHA